MTTTTVPRLGVVYRAHGANEDAFVAATSPDEQDELITDLLANMGIRGQAVTVTVQPDPAIYQMAARNLVVETGENLAEDELSEADALNLLAPLAPNMSEQQRTDLLRELVHEIRKANRIEARDYDRNMCELHEDQEYLEAACEAAVIEAADKLVGEDTGKAVHEPAGDR